MKDGLLIAGVAVMVLTAVDGRAAVLCQKRSGAVFVRDTCRKKEKALPLADLGVIGPKGDPGAPGAAGVVNAFSTFADTRGPSADPSLPSTSPGRTLAQLELPAGSFVIETVGEFAGTIQTASWYVECRLEAGGQTLLATLAEDKATLGSSSGSMLSVVLPIDLTSPGTATFSCSDTTSQQAEWTTVTMVAYQVARITLQ